MPYMPSLPEGASQRDLFVRYPEAARPLARFTEVLMRGPSPLTVAQRELIAAYTSGVNGCSYCVGVHRETAKAFGVDGDTLEALLDDLDAAPVDEELKPILRFARKLTERPSKVTRADADAIFEAGWGDDAFHHAVSIVALFNYYNRILDGHGIELDERYYRKAGEALHDGGYAAIADMLEP